jgi:predicted nucleotidyltransferase
MYIEKLDIIQVRGLYGFNDCRKELMKKLEQELAYIRQQVDKLVVLIFGSFITDEPFPHDVDLFISFIPSKDCVADILTYGLHRLHPDVIDIQYRKLEYDLFSAEELVEYFNNNPMNFKEGISLDRVIELVDVC